ncbi:hypothetical protein ACWGKQ_28615 [Streptomyces sp. NPDC054770]
MRALLDRPPGVASQLDALDPVCKPIPSEEISTRVNTRPELEKALKLAYDIKEAAAPDQEGHRTKSASDQQE